MLRFALLVLVSTACAASDAPAPALPGAESHPKGLAKRMAKALKAKGPGYEPRTHHFNEDGSPKYTNRLILETSPYLLQHAHNPVDWYPWGDEAFAAARRLDRPVLLSVGYSTCHWCHVMERESFEDEEIAAYINAHYIPVKVDREERPDVDAVYMSAVQMMTGRGGWPMTVWLTPDREPFWGGTYFPARDGDRGARTGFLTLLRRIDELYHGNRSQLLKDKDVLVQRIRDAMDPDTAAATIPGVAALEKAAAHYKTNFDPEWGGMRQAPKFPSTMPIRFLLREHRRSGDEKLLEMARLTLRRMAEGGIYDQLGGGFHRYSVDELWLVPHFEKMLYDNALLTVAYLEGFQATGEESFAEVAREIVAYAAREMTGPEGGFYSATDADSPTPEGHDEEGWFFTWTPAEIRALLQEHDAKLVERYYRVSEAGNFEGRNILHVRRPLDDVAGELEMEPEAARKRLEAARQVLYDARGKRPPPIRDDKVLASWNGLMISAFATAGRVLDEPQWTERAATAASFVVDKMRVKGRLRRSYNDGAARHAAFLDDYAFMIRGLLDLHEASFDPRWLDEAIALQKVLDAHYADGPEGGYFMTADDHEQLLAREKPSYDGAEPSGNSVALMNLLRLSELTTDDAFRKRADGILKTFSRKLDRVPMASAEMLLALDFRIDRAKEIVIVAPESKAQAKPFLAALESIFLPNRVLVVATAGKDLETQAKTVPLLTGKRPLGGEVTAYVCEEGLCKKPAKSVAVFVEQLRPAAE